MVTDEEFLSDAKKQIESKLGWGSSADWKNQDFIALTKRIQEETGASLSHMTMKRIWGKVKYDGLPQIYTLNHLVKFIGYESWRDFVVKSTGETTDQNGGQLLPGSRSGSRRWAWAVLVVFLVVGALAVATLILIRPAEPAIDPADYSFTSRATINAGVPNSVVFNFTAARATTDSVIIQQSWDTKRRTRVSKKDTQHTLIYYFPGFFEPKLIVADKVVKEHGLLIKSDGWLTAIVRSPMPVYFSKQDVLRAGTISLPLEKIKGQNISLVPEAPSVSYCMVQDFGKLFTDDFVFETSVRNDFREGSAACQTTNIYLLCEGAAVGIPLCAKGCESSNNFFFTNYSVSGKQNDLSAFGVDFNEFVRIKVVSSKGKALVYVNEKLAYTVDHEITRSKIIGIDFVFQGTGSVDYVRLSNHNLSFVDEF